MDIDSVCTGALLALPYVVQSAPVMEEPRLYAVMLMELGCVDSVCFYTRN